MKAATLGKAILISGGGLVLFLLGCAGGQANLQAHGVSASVVTQANAIGARLFVPKKYEREAESAAREGVQHYQACDSVLALLKAERDRLMLPAADSLHASSSGRVVALQSSSAPELRLRQLEIQATYNLQEARHDLEKSVRLNPLPLRPRHFLAATYKQLAERYPRTMSFDQPAKIWAELARLEPGEYFHFYNLGECFYAQQKWEEAWKNFKQAEQVLLAAAEVNEKRLRQPQLPPAAALDSLTLFYAIYYQGQCAIKRFDDRQALFNLERAKDYVNNPALQASIAEDIRWIKWDGGNILASVYRDSAAVLAAQNRYGDAVQVYEKLLGEILKTKRARDEIIWAYANIEYQQLNHKVSAVVRLDAALQNIPKDAQGAAVDTTYEEDFASYGAMCYNLGIDTLRVNRRVAYEYFARAAAIKWKDRGKSYLQMAELAQSNADISIRDGENALALSEQLTSEQLKKLYRLLIDSYRNKNQLDKARIYFDKLKAMH